MSDVFKKLAQEDKIAEIQLDLKQVLHYIIMGIKNGNYQAAVNLAQDCIAELEKNQEE